MKLHVYDCLRSLLAFDSRMVQVVTQKTQLPFIKLETANSEQIRYKTDTGSQQSFMFHIFAKTIAEVETIEKSLFEQFYNLSIENAQVYNRQWYNNGMIIEEDGTKHTIITIEFTLKDI